MTALEWTLFGISLAVVTAVFVTEALRARGLTFSKLPPPMVLALRITLGIVFAILGVIGSLLPVMQGWLFFLMAVLVLFPQSRFAIKAVDRCEKRMPRLVARLRRWGIGVHRADESDADNDDQAIRPRVL